MHPNFRQLDDVNLVIATLVHSESLAIGAQWCKNKKKSCRVQAAKSKERKGVEHIYNRLWESAKEDLIIATQKHVFETARDLIVNTIMETENNDEEEVEELNEVFNRQASLNATSMERDYFTARGGGRRENAPHTPAQTFVQKRRIVKEELQKYFDASEHDEAFSNPMEKLYLPVWIKKWGKKFPNVTRCMAAFFGVPSISSGIELDFYFKSLLLTKRRMSMRGEVAEMLHMTDRNQRFIDLSQVRIIKNSRSRVQD